MEYFEGKTVLLTGSTSGLGKSLLFILSRVRTCKIVITGRSPEKLSCLSRQLKDSLATIKTAELDLESPDREIDECISSIFKIHGVVNVAFNCAGMGFRGRVIETLGDVDRRVMQVDYFGQRAVIKSLLKRWEESGCASWDIVQVSSVQGYIGIGERASYAAAKHALIGFVDSLRVEFDEYPKRSMRRVMHVCPGYIATNHSVNSIRGDGTVYAEQDASTLSGFSPEYVAQRMLDGCVRGDREMIICDRGVRILLWIRALFPGLGFRILRNKYMGVKESIMVTVFKWLFSV